MKLSILRSISVVFPLAGVYYICAHHLCICIGMCAYKCCHKLRSSIGMRMELLQTVDEVASVGQQFYAAVALSR